MLYIERHGVVGPVRFILVLMLSGMGVYDFYAMY